MEPISLYVHVPFCERRCAYCDFNTFAGLGRLTDAYVKAASSQIERSPERGRKVDTIFFGGGTPTFLAPLQLAKIMEAVRRNFAVEDGAEITSEANPGSGDGQRFAAMRRMGFNRISIGVQSFNDALLRKLGRIHTAEEARTAFHGARQAGFANVNLDLMFGLPAQSFQDWCATLEQAVCLGPEHLSVYALTIEPGTPFHKAAALGKLDLPDEQLQNDMYEWAIERLERAGYEHYEISNFALPGFRCRHNLNYWHNGEYLGFGPGAVSYLKGRRWKTEPDLTRYITKLAMGEDTATEQECLPPLQALGETLMVGIRLMDGVDLDALGRRFECDAHRILGDALFELERAGLVERSAGRVHLTRRGLLFADDVACALVMPDGDAEQRPIGVS
ncbi:MAG: radical SAM family heme chaperone HemW [Chthonomonadales bacterium]